MQDRDKLEVQDMNREEAWALLNEYNKDPFHLEHGEIVGKTMHYFAEKLGYGAEAVFFMILILNSIRINIVSRVRKL